MKKARTIKLGGSYDRDPSPFHQFIEEQNRAILFPKKITLSPCTDCGNPREPASKLDLEMTEVQAIMMQQEIDAGCCFACASRRSQARMERALRELREVE